MTEYAFPRDLLDGSKTRWQTVPDQRFELPEDQHPVVTSLRPRSMLPCFRAKL